MFSLEEVAKNAGADIRSEEIKRIDLEKYKYEFEILFFQNTFVNNL